MRKLGVLFFLLMVAVIAGCSKREYEVNIVIPAGTQGEMVYSDMEVSPKGNTVKISTGEGLGDTSVCLKPVDSGEEYEPQGEYLTGGITVELSAEHGKWYRIGIRSYNETDQDITVTVKVRGAELRIS